MDEVEADLLHVWVKYGAGRPVKVNVSPQCNVNGLRSSTGARGDEDGMAHEPDALVTAVVTSAGGGSDEWDKDVPIKNIAYVS